MKRLPLVKHEQYTVSLPTFYNRIDSEYRSQEENGIYTDRTIAWFQTVKD